MSLKPYKVCYQNKSWSIPKILAFSPHLFAGHLLLVHFRASSVQGIIIMDKHTHKDCVLFNINNIPVKGKIIFLVMWLWKVLWFNGLSFPQRFSFTVPEQCKMCILTTLIVELTLYITGYIFPNGHRWMDIHLFAGMLQIKTNKTDIGASLYQWTKGIIYMKYKVHLLWQLLGWATKPYVLKQKLLFPLAGCHTVMN